MDIELECKNLVLSNNLKNIIEFYYNNILDKTILELLFKFSCRYGNLDIIQWIYNIENHNIVIKWHEFDEICNYGYIDIVKFVYMSFDTSAIISNLNRFFETSCCNGHLELSKWFYSICEITKKEIQNIFNITCTEGYLDIIQWLKSLIDNITITHNVFNMIIKNGHIEVAKWIFESKLYNNPKIEAYNYACVYGYLESAIWLKSVSKKATIMKQSLISVCCNGHLDILNYVIDNEDDIELTIEHFINSVKSGNIELSKYILKINPVIYDDIILSNSITYNHLFCLSCEYGSLEMCKFLLSIFPNIYISYNSEYPFRIACLNNNKAIAKWLIEINPYIDILIDPKNNDKNILYKICKKNRNTEYKKIANWLISLDSTNDLFIIAFKTIIKNYGIDEIKFMISLDYPLSLNDYNIGLKICCKNSKYNNAKYLISKERNIDISIDNNYNFRKAVKNFDTNIAKLLYSIKPSLINDIKLDELFTYCCKKDNNKEHLEWLYSLDNTLINKININDIINNNCIHGNYEIVKWLYLLKSDIIIDINTFQICCMNNFHQLAIWIYSIQPNIDITSNNHLAFRTVCDNEYTLLAEWFITIYPGYSIYYDIDDEGIDYIIKRSLPIDTSKKIIHNEGDLCPICYHQNIDCQINCTHYFCLECLKKHYNYRTNCPICRSEILNCYLLDNK